MKACIVIPCYNHASTIAEVAQAAAVHGPVIVVDDCSTDPVRLPAGIQVIRFDRNRGKAAALRAGFQCAAEHGYTHVITMDADGQHSAEDVPQFLAIAKREPCALLVGVRDFVAAGAPTGRRRTNAFSNFWFRVQTGLRLNDTQCGFRCYPLSLVQRLRTRSERYAFELEVLVRSAWSGATLVTVPVQCSYRPDQVLRSHFRPWLDMWQISRLNSRLTMQAFLVPQTLRAAWSVGRVQTRREVIREFFAEHAHEPGQLAGAVGLGLFFAIMPIWGYQMLAAAALAHRLRLNKAIALVASNISIPPVAPFILWGGLELGNWLFTGQWLELSAGAMTRATVWEHLGHWFVGSIVLAMAVGATGMALAYGVARLMRRG